MFATVQRAKAQPGCIDQAVLALRNAAMGRSVPQQTILLANRHSHG
jgi:hypothetical protein